MIKKKNVAWRWKAKPPDQKASVYMHTVPNGRMYIGVTCRDPELRWQRNGSAYRCHPVFFADIQKYGWDNIKHEILFQSFDENEAYEKEEELIRSYKEKYGDLMYNVTFGRKHTDNYKKSMSKKLNGRVIGESTRKKLSQARQEKFGVDIVCWETGERFRGYKQAGESKNITNYQNIVTACTHFPDYTLGGFHWYRVGDNINEGEQLLIKADTLPVRCVETGEVFSSANEAARAVNYSHPIRIVRICDGSKSKAAAYSWEWA